MRVQVGVLETYKPDREIKSIHKKLAQIKANAEKQLAKLTKIDSSIQEMVAELQSKPKLEEKWKSYLEKKFSPELEKIMDRIDKKNELICPGYLEKRQAQN